MSEGPASQDPELLRRLLRAKDRMDSASRAVVAGSGTLTRYACMATPGHHLNDSIVSVSCRLECSDDAAPRTAVSASVLAAIARSVAAEDGPGLQSSNNAPNLAEELATYVAGLHSSEIDAATVERVKSHLVDTLGCGIAAFDEGPVRICPGQDTETGVNALIKNARELPQELCKSLTWDRGKEMAGHKRFTLATDIQVYFCDPRSPWQRGSNETRTACSGGLPKGIDISSYPQAKLNAVARQLNERPRKTPGYQTPAEMFSQTVALTS